MICRRNPRHNSSSGRDGREHREGDAGISTHNGPPRHNKDKDYHSDYQRSSEYRGGNGYRGSSHRYVAPPRHAAAFAAMNQRRSVNNNNRGGNGFQGCNKTSPITDEGGKPIVAEDTLDGNDVPNNKSSGSQPHSKSVSIFTARPGPCMFYTLRVMLILVCRGTAL